MNDVAEALDRLRSRFLARAADDLDNLRRWTTDPPADAEDLHRLVHRLSGAAGTFGFRQLSDLAATAEDALVTGRSDSMAALTALMEELDRLATRTASD